MPSSSKIFTAIIYIFLIFYFASFFFQKINLVTADLGRHITNGREIASNLRPINTNYYSYTEQYFPTIMHHWGAGVLYFFTWSITGFVGLSLLNGLLMGVGILLFYLVASRKSNKGLVLLFFIISVPLVANRVEVRPETLSLFFLGLYYFVLEKLSWGEISFKKTLPFLLLLQLIWANSHIFFIFGFVLSGVYFLNALLIQKSRSKALQYGTISLSLTLISLVTPFGIYGFLEPFNILKEYGYMIIENQSIFFMQKRFPQFLYFHFELYAGVLAVFSLLMLVLKKTRDLFVPWFLAVTFFVLAFKFNRMIPIATLMGLVFFVGIIHKLAPYIFNMGRQMLLERLAQIFSIVLIVVNIGFPDHYFAVVKKRFGLGLLNDIQQSADFYLERGLAGPIFNNYDIGGYLIFNLFPSERVFVDNRPEAYSVEFFKEVYNPLLRYDSAWEEKSAEYGFNTIFFYRRDITQWAQPFLIERIRDAEWVPVFVDEYVLILVKNIAENREVIEQYRIPENVFVVTS